MNKLVRIILTADVQHTHTHHMLHYMYMYIHPHYVHVYTPTLFTCRYARIIHMYMYISQYYALHTSKGRKNMHSACISFACCRYCTKSGYTHNIHVRI